MKILFLGDIVAAAGRQVIRAFVPEMKRAEKYDFVIANGENAAGGLGIDEKCALELYECGIDLITGGNHSWDKREVIEFMGRDRRLIRPANYPEDPRFPIPGKGHAVLEPRDGSGARLGILNLMGRVHMDPLDDPFAIGSRWLDWFEEHGVRCVLVDFHGEVTSEKQAFAHYVAGRASAVVGTHTHVQTADERLIVGSSGRRTAYITDAGMTGPYDSVIGMRKEKSIQRFLSKMPMKYEAAEGQPGLHGVVIDIDDRSGEATAIRRVSRFL
jgi:metallophosphoesterase (TIGR00282 family)